MGGLWDLKVMHSSNLAGQLMTLKEAGFTCFGADLEGTAVGTWKPVQPSVMILGSEAHGLSAWVKAALDERIAIPSRHPNTSSVESLNVAVAAGILMQHWTD